MYEDDAERVFNIDLPILAPGDEDEMVFVLQAILDAKGYSGCGERCPYNGLMDEATVYALNRFKRDCELRPNGKVDARAWQILFSSYTKYY